MQKNHLTNVLQDCEKNNVVAFKHKAKNTWFTGIITAIYPPDQKRPEYYITIDVNLPIVPQWYSDNDQTVFYLEDISEVVILESINSNESINNNLINDIIFRYETMITKEKDHTKWLIDKNAPLVLIQQSEDYYNYLLQQKKHYQEFVNWIINV